MDYICSLLRTVIKNPKSLRTLVEVIAEAGATEGGCPRSKGNLLNTVATRVRPHTTQCSGLCIR